jgi:hypothetical protein
MAVAVALCAAARLSLILIEMNPTTDTRVTSAEASSRAVSEARHPRRPCCRRRGLLSATIHLPCFVAASYFQLHFPIRRPSAQLSSSRPHPAARCSRQPWVRSQELQRCSWAFRANPWLSQRGPRSSAWLRAAPQTSRAATFVDQISFILFFLGTPVPFPGFPRKEHCATRKSH